MNHRKEKSSIFETSLSLKSQCSFKPQKKNTNAFKSNIKFKQSARGQNMPRSKKEKAAGLEQHKQLQRAKEMKRKQRKQVALPTKHTKGQK
jgi:hypothetical protein